MSLKGLCQLYFFGLKPVDVPGGQRIEEGTTYRSLGLYMRSVNHSGTMRLTLIERSSPKGGLETPNTRSATGWRTFTVSAGESSAPQWKRFLSAPKRAVPPAIDP